jgi:hypothetical protein
VSTFDGYEEDPLLYERCRNSKREFAELVTEIARHVPPWDTQGLKLSVTGGWMRGSMVVTYKSTRTAILDLEKNRDGLYELVWLHDGNDSAVFVFQDDHWEATDKRDFGLYSGEDLAFKLVNILLAEAEFIDFNPY